MNIRYFKQIADLENKKPLYDQIFIGTRNAANSEHLVDFIQIHLHGEVPHNMPGTLKKIILTGIMVSQGKVSKFERSFRPELIEKNIERHQRLDYADLYAEINDLAALVQKDLIGSLINTFDPLFKDNAFVSWWNTDAAENELIKPEEVSVDDKSAIIASAFAGQIVHDLMLKSLEKYFKAYLAAWMSKVDFEKSFCDCNTAN